LQRESGSLRVAETTRGAGDLRVDGNPVDLAARRRDVIDLPWTWLRQVHGARCVTVTRPGEHAGVAADAAVTAVPGAALAVHVADCAPVGLLADEGVVGVVHAGWRGLEAGVVETAVRSMRELGARDIVAVRGACIHPECYEFGEADLDRLAATLGPEVRGTTAAGRPALDLPAAVRAALAAAGVTEVRETKECTACDGKRWWSHRARGDVARQALVVWMDP
jgi:polyphenol oxidase